MGSQSSTTVTLKREVIVFIANIKTASLNKYTEVTPTILSQSSINNNYHHDCDIMINIDIIAQP